MGCKVRKQKSTGGKTLLLGIGIIVSSMIVMMIPIMEAAGYIPAPPSGPRIGYVNFEYQYEITTMNRDASWMFDWGDGGYTSWRTLDDSSTAIAESHRWTNPGNYTVRIKFKNTMYPDGIWSDPMVVSISYPLMADYPTEPTLVCGTVKGLNETLYTYTIQGTDPHGYRLRYRIDFGDGLLSNWTSLVTSGSQSMFTHRWTYPGNYSIIFQATNEYQLNSAWSSPRIIIIQNRSANTTLCKDLLVIGTQTDFITYTADDYLGTFTNTTSGRSSDVRWNGEGTYYIDDDMDGKWEYEYNPASGMLQVIPPAVIAQIQQGWP